MGLSAWIDRLYKRHAVAILLLGLLALAMLHLHRREAEHRRLCGELLLLDARVAERICGDRRAASRNLPG